MPPSSPNDNDDTQRGPLPSAPASVRPSDPRPPSRHSFPTLDGIDSGDSPPARLQMIVALILGLVLVAIPLYLWRRPRAESIAASSGPDAGMAAFAPLPVEETRVVLGEPRVRECQDG